MNREQVIEMVFAELKRAEEIHTSWPDDPIHCAAIVAEEAGELIQASIDYHYKTNKGVHLQRIITETIQTTAMGFRLLFALADEGKPFVKPETDLICDDCEETLDENNSP